MNIRRLNDLSLKWKLIIPFLFLAAMGASALFLVSYRFQSRLIHLDEEGRLRNLYQVFLNDIAFKKNMALSLAQLSAGNPEVAKALAHKDRERLKALTLPVFSTLFNNFGVRQFHFHVLPGVSFLRLHAPDRYGDDLLPHRPTIRKVLETGKGVGGIEWGATGLSIRSVAPVLRDRRLIGTVEMGLSLGKPLLEEFKTFYGVEIALYLRAGPKGEEARVFAATFDHFPPPSETFRKVVLTDAVVVRPEIWGKKQTAAIYGPLKDFSGKTIGAVRIVVDRGPTLELLQRYALTAAALGLLGLIISVAFVWVVAVLYTRRIQEVVAGAEAIAAGRRNIRLPAKSGDELDIMARAINRMLTSLDASELRLKEYARNLEETVEQRTRSLRESERTYRTLVENVPLIVYMTDAEGRTLFLNRATEQIFGLPPEALNGPFEKWSAHIHPEDRGRVLEERRKSLQERKELHTEYRLIHPNGHWVYCLDHAVPVTDESKEHFRMDGILIDVTAQKELQKKSLQAQELETLRQISRRLAHELRNPLTAIGGLARRLAAVCEPQDARAEKGRLIFQEVRKVEKILNAMLAFISPQEVVLKPRPLNPLVARTVEEIRKILTDPDLVLSLKLDPEVGEVLLDEDLFEKALAALLENARERMDRQGVLEIMTQKEPATAVVRLNFPVVTLTQEDLDHFFFPFIGGNGTSTDEAEVCLPDVSLSRLIIHKHGGSIQIAQEPGLRMQLTIRLPLPGGEDVMDTKSQS
jgi:PAS domain S-box-containing protein